MTCRARVGIILVFLLGLPTVSFGRAVPCVHLAGTLVDHTRNHGTDRRIWSAALCQKRDLYVYLPPGFDPHCRYPVLIWLHGIIEDERDFLDRMLPSLDAAMVSGQMPPTIVAFPDGSLRGRPAVMHPQPLFANSKLGRFEDFVVQDVWGFLQQQYPIRPERQAHALGGYSAGGAAAYRMGIMYRDQFGVVLGVAPPLNLRWLDCHGCYFSRFDPDCWGWRTRIVGHEVVGRFYCVVVIRLGQLITPLYGRGAAAVEMMSLGNPIEMLDRLEVQPGQLAMYIAYGGKDEFNIAAQVESFLFRAQQRHLEVAVSYDPNARHQNASVTEFLPQIVSWLAPRLLLLHPDRALPFPSRPEDVMIEGTYRHFKGKLYVALALVKHSETEEEMVLYRPIDSDQLWVRPLAMWTEHVERADYSGPRFVRIGAAQPTH